MSMEQAILELAAAMRENTAALIKASEATVHSTDAYKESMAAYTAPADEIRVKPISVESTPTNVRENKVTTAGLDKAAPAAVAPDAELEAAVTKVEEESKALDYKTDVRPVLLALAKKAGQPALKDLLTKYGAATGDKLTPDQFAGIVADANALIAG